MKSVAVATRTGLQLEEFTGTVYRRCQACQTPNPDWVTCPSCLTLNVSGQPCRHCRGPGGPPKPVWESCPNCGTPAVIERNAIYFHRSRWRRIWHAVTRFLKGLSRG